MCVDRPGASVFVGDGVVDQVLLGCSFVFASAIVRVCRSCVERSSSCSLLVLVRINSVRRVLDSSFVCLLVWICALRIRQTISALSNSSSVASVSSACAVPAQRACCRRVVSRPRPASSGVMQSLGALARRPSARLVLRRRGLARARKSPCRSGSLRRCA